MALRAYDRAYNAKPHGKFLFIFPPPSFSACKKMIQPAILKWSYTQMWLIKIPHIKAFTCFLMVSREKENAPQPAIYNNIKFTLEQQLIGQLVQY
jgi:hypothetical protein